MSIEILEDSVVFISIWLSFASYSLKYMNYHIHLHGSFV